MIDTTNTTATTFAENTDCTTSGKILHKSISLVAVNPIPTERDNAAIVIFLCVNPAFAIIWIPETIMVPNIMIVHPPNTDSGSDAKKLPTGGKRPAKIIHPAPVAIVKRLITFVILTSPTFCENDVTGGQPNNAEIADAKPSHAKDPEISSEVMSLSRPPDTIAVVSPIVSAADTKKMIATEKIAPIWNSGEYGKSFGREIIPSEKITDKSTFPIMIATIYPTMRPARTDNCFSYPFAKMFHPRQTTRVIVPNNKFDAEPKSSVYPPPKDLAPTVNKEYPIAVTTDAATIGAMIFLQYFAKRPIIPSKSPPQITAPITAG